MNTRIFELCILGCGAALPAYGRYPSSQLLNIHEEWMLIDCGEGSQFQLNKYNLPKSKISKVFISHLHGDHIYGLPGLLTSYQLQDRKAAIEIFGPVGIESMLRQVLTASYSRIAYDIVIHEIEDFNSKIIFENEHFEVRSLPLDHTIPCLGYLFREKSLKRSLDLQKLEELSIPVQSWSAIEKGDSITLPSGIHFTNQELTKEAKPLRSFAYCSDTRYKSDLSSFLENVDLLYHEASFLEKEKDKAEDRGHSTAFQAGQIALASKAKRLVLGHFSSRYKDLEDIEKECCSVFPHCWIGREGMRIRYPYAADEVWEISQMEAAVW